jgi:hypothetical protein
MKKEYLLLIISLLFLSCHKDGKSVINRNKKEVSIIEERETPFTIL